jgi:Tn7-like transposition protein D/TniQ
MNIGLFPDPHPEELLYSACARYDGRMRYPNKAAALREMFGSSSAAAMVDLPARIDNLVAVLPPFHAYTADRLVEENTHFTYYAPFLPRGRASALKDDMRGAGGNHVRERVGLTASHIQLPAALRFCPVCVMEDRSKFEETYWHRVHQITGVDVCPDHAVFLEMSHAPWRDRKNPYRFYSADDAVYAVKPRHLNLSQADHSIRLKVARDALWLLRSTSLSLDLDTLRQRYYSLLLEQGYAYYNGRVRVNRLLKALTEFFSPEYLTEIRCPIGSPSSAWPLRLVSKDGMTAAQNPIRHLLLMAFVGRTAEQIFTSSGEFKPFGEGPWPCLNRASTHYGKLLIGQCHITDCIVKKRSGKPEGTFACRCGFTYKRIGPDASEEDRLKRDSVQTYGPVWEKALRRLWSQVDVPLQRVGSGLGVSELTTVRYAIRLGLPMNEPGLRRVSRKTIERYGRYRKTRLGTLEAYRKCWLGVLEANRGATRHQLMEASGYLYSWLRKNDGEWIEAHLPPRRERDKRPRGRSIDWEEIDQKLSRDLVAAAISIKCLPGKPVRALLAALIKKVGCRRWIQRYRQKLPLSAEAICEHAESLAAFAIRKITWSEEYFYLKGIMPTRAQFIRYTGLFNKTGRAPEIQNAIDMAVSNLTARIQ